MNNIQLIKCPCQEQGLLADKWYTPLNLIWIANYLKAHGIETQIIDGIHLNVGEIIKNICAPIVGINFNVLSTKSMEEIAQASKDRGSIVVVGGQAATPLAKQLLTKNRNIDVVVLGDGEEAMLELARRVEKGICSFKGIPNIAYRDRDRIVFSDSRQMDLTTLPFPDRKIDGIDMEKYIR